jgi:hypothetical protein
MGRKALIPGSAFVVCIFGAASAHAMGDGPTLPPDESPYAIWEPQTAEPSSEQSPPPAHSDRLSRHNRKLLPRFPPAKSKVR